MQQPLPPLWLASVRLRREWEWTMCTRDFVGFCLVIAEMVSSCASLFQTAS